MVSMSIPPAPAHSSWLTAPLEVENRAGGLRATSEALKARRRSPRRTGAASDHVTPPDLHPDESKRTDGSREEVQILKPPEHHPPSRGVAAWRRGGVAAWRRGGVAAWRRGGVAAWRRGGVAAQRFSC
ncbi:hypothetical protein EYF80_066704 [Liparis tanakae]|uniref:Uncharacterized protein n=1 Tax=Liparis tanakae TaxID=230148 RepID=A0A4Z2E344_9TELE|nr:hypothetical protein EYF80_066704 [Liparis tanakae]